MSCCRQHPYPYGNLAQAWKDTLSRQWPGKDLSINKRRGAQQIMAKQLWNSRQENRPLKKSLIDQAPGKTGLLVFQRRTWIFDL